MTLVVRPEEIARRLGIAQPLEESDRWLLEQAIEDAQNDLGAYLGRPLTPQTYTETGMAPLNGQYVLRYWPLLAIVSTTAETDIGGQPTGYFTVVYTAGLDATADPELGPLRRFVRTHALYSATVQDVFRRLSPETARRVTALGVEGQSVTYSDTYAVEQGASDMGLVGALPTFASCDRWRLAGRRVVQGQTRSGELWPFDRSRGW